MFEYLFFGFFGVVIGAIVGVVLQSISGSGLLAWFGAITTLLVFLFIGWVENQ